jgi:hypothetical protein
LLRKTRREVHAILAIVSEPADFSKEDKIVRRMTRNDKTAGKAVKAARKRIPTPEQQATNQGENKQYARTSV